MKVDFKKKLDFVLDRKSKNLVIKSIFLNLFTSFLELLSIGILIPLFYSILSEESELITKLKNIHPFISNNFFEFIILSVFFIYLVKLIFSLIFNIKINNYLYEIYNILTFRIFSFYVNKNYSFFFKKNSSEITRNVYSEVGIFVEQIIQNFILIIKDSVLVLLICIFLFYFDFFNTSIIIISFLFIILIYFLFLKNFLYSIGENIKNRKLSFLNDLSEIFKGIKEIKIFGLETSFISRFKKNFLSLSKYMRISRTFAVLPRLIFEFYIIIIFLIIIYFLVASNQPSNILILKLGVFAIAIIRITPSAIGISQKFQVINIYQASINNIYNELKNINDDFLRNKNLKSIEKKEIISKIEVKNLDFKYSSEKVIFKNVNITLEKNKIIGIIGESGSGKSTFADLISGIVEPNSGEIIINDKFHLNEIKEFMKNNIGYVTQTNFLFDHSIIYNITLGEKNFDFNLEKDKAYIMKILEKVKLLNYVNSLKDGLNTVIGESGISLSGGLKQRLIIARSLFRNPKILIMDEATNSLDSKNEKSIMEILNLIKNDVIVLLITHQKNLLDYCDKVYILKENNLIEEGK